MRISKVTLFTGAFLLLVIVAGARADTSGRIYGRLTTVDGDVFEGLIRWDKNEGSWVDFLNGNKELPRSSRSGRKNYRDKRKKIRIFGIPIGYSERYSYGISSAQSGIRFGHIVKMEIIDDDAVELTLKSGQTVEFESGSTDIGNSIRDLVIEDRDEGEIGFEWEDVASIEFLQGDPALTSTFGDALYGTVYSRGGDEFTGWIGWDIDELFTRDEIDGKEGRRNRKVKFSRIRIIERRNSSSATLTLTNGEEMDLHDTNDVDDSNRGIVISDIALGQIVLKWDEFDRAEFKVPERQIRYDYFDGGSRIRGTVYTDGGGQYTGYIRWDDDEEYTWEMLDGNYDDMEFDIEFVNIAEIERKGYRSSTVTLWDGREFDLRGSNDVDDDNKGIFIELDSGDEVEVDWDEFERAVFVKR